MANSSVGVVGVGAGAPHTNSLSINGVNEKLLYKGSQ